MDERERDGTFSHLEYTWKTLNRLVQTVLNRLFFMMRSIYKYKISSLDIILYHATESCIALFIFVLHDRIYKGELFYVNH